MNIKIIQHNEFSMFAVFSFEDFLNEKEHEIVTNAIKESLQQDQSLNYSTNVQAQMTDWTFMVNREDMDFFFKKVSEMMMIVNRLRSPNPDQKMSITYNECWAMKHSKGDFTNNHVHGPMHTSGSYNAIVPNSEQYMAFPDFKKTLQIKPNQLIFFDGIVKHSVNEHVGIDPRYSLAFNTTIDYNPQQ